MRATALPRRGRSARPPFALAAAVAVVAVVATVPAAAPAAAVTQPTVTVTPNTDISDGQALVINVKATVDVPVSAAIVHLCRPGVDYTSSPVFGNTPISQDFALNGPNCPLQALSSSGDVQSNDYASGFSDPAGESFLFHAGSGVVNWNDASGAARTLTCDADNPCALVIELLQGTGANQVWQPYVVTLHYAKVDAYAGCGGPADAIVDSGGSDRMIDAWVAWTKQECGHPGRTGAATRASFVGEGEAVKSFQAGTVDIAYTAGGFDADMGLAGSLDPGTSPRGSIAVPVAVNAAVLGVAGGQHLSGHDIPFKDVKLKADEVATMMTGGVLAIGSKADAILQRNPQFTSVFSTTTAGFVMGAYAGAEATTWYTTKWLTSLAASSWVVPDNTVYFGADAKKPRGVATSYALAQPSFQYALDLLTGRPQMRKGLSGVASDSKGVWVATDLSSASKFSLASAAIANSNGDFVAPTPSSLTAAVGTMKADAQGMLIMDPTAVAPSGSQQPYPLTMVEYALVPTEPLVDASTCTARTASQDLLKGWLNYITGDGQSQLPAGMVPLTPDLAATAKTAIDKVGTSAVTGTCAGKVGNLPPGSAQAPGTTAAPAASGDQSAASPDAPGGGSGTGSGGSPPGGSKLGSNVGVGVATGASSSTGTAGPTQAALAASSSPKVDIPGFGGASAISWVLTIFTLLGIVVVSSAAALATSGRLSILRDTRLGKTRVGKAVLGRIAPS